MTTQQHPAQINTGTGHTEHRVGYAALLEKRHREEGDPA
jgi:hypothetical protein